MLWKKSKIPFEMSKEFINRFTDPTELSFNSAFEFLSSDIVDNYIDNIFKEMHN
jgi:hypothetical protein